MLENLSHTQKNLLGFGIFAAATTGIILAVRAYNNKEQQLLLDYATNQLHYDNNPKKQIEAVSGTGITDLAKKYPGDPAKYVKLSPASTTVGDVVVDFKKAISGAGTDLPLFFATLNKIKNIYTYQLASEVYRRLNGETLVDAIKGESKLYSPLWNSASIKYSPVLAYIFSDGAHYNPDFSNYINSLPEI